MFGPDVFGETGKKRFMWGFPKIRGTLLGVPVIRTIIFWGLYWGPLILGNYHVEIPRDNRRLSIGMTTCGASMLFCIIGVVYI